MGEVTKIGWTHHTFSPWWGCTKVSEACRDCYADTWARRTGFKIWGQEAPRRFFGDKLWHNPLKWNRAAEEAQERRRVFCASMADVFEQLPEDHPQREEMEGARSGLWRLIEATPWLDWLLLTKRPENVGTMVPPRWWELNPFGRVSEPGRLHESGWPSNAWLGFTAENQETFDARWERAKNYPAPVIFTSVEPQLGEVVLPAGRKPDWIINGGESGGRARRMDPEWTRKLRNQCRENGIPFFMKQVGSVLARELGLNHPKGEDPTEWPPSIQIQQFPQPRVAA